MKKATVKERKQAENILINHSRNHNTKDIRLRAILESIIVNGWEANYTKHIYPYIEKYYQELTENYKWNRWWFTSVVNAKVQQYTKDKSNFCWIELFERIGRWTYRLLIK